MVPVFILSGMGTAGDPALHRYERSKQGIGKNRTSQIQAGLGCTDDEMARIVGVSRNTFRARANSSGFSEAEVDQLLRVEGLLAEARDIFGDTGDIRAWLRRPNRSLGGLVPQEMLNNPSGAESVHGVLRRMRYGVYA